MPEESQLPVNQTRFTFEEPLFEQPTTFPSEEETAPKPMWYKTKKGLLMIVATVLVILVLLLMLAAYLGPQNGTRPADDITVQPTPSPVLTPNQQKINDLKAELKAADPATQEFPFPPVMLDISLPDPNK